MENERLITLEEVAERMQVSVPTVRRWIKARKLPATKPSGVYRVRGRDLEEFIETGKAPAPSASGRGVGSEEKPPPVTVHLEAQALHATAGPITVEVGELQRVLRLVEEGQLTTEDAVRQLTSSAA